MQKTKAEAKRRAESGERANRCRCIEAKLFIIPSSQEAVQWQKRRKEGAAAAAVVAKEGKNHPKMTTLHHQVHCINQSNERTTTSGVTKRRTTKTTTMMMKTTIHNFVNNFKPNHSQYAQCHPMGIVYSVQYPINFTVTLESPTIPSVMKYAITSQTIQMNNNIFYISILIHMDMVRIFWVVF